MVRNAGGKVLTNTSIVDAIVEDKKVNGVIIENKSGQQAILADAVIDTTGDADIAYRAGAPIDKLPEVGLSLEYGNTVPRWRNRLSKDSRLC